MSCLLQGLFHQFRIIDAAPDSAKPGCHLIIVALRQPGCNIIVQQFHLLTGDLTSLLLIVYIAGLPAYVATEVLTRGLIALHDTQTPLVTNCAQLMGRIALIWMWLEPWGVVAIPAAFALTSALETLTLGMALRWRMRVKVEG